MVPEAVIAWAHGQMPEQELEDTKVTALRQIQEVIRQSDQTIKSVRTGAPLERWEEHLPVRCQDH